MTSRHALSFGFSWLVGFGALAVLTACPPAVPPAPVPPDATDAAPAPASDASAPTTPCQVACDNITRLCGAQLPDCVPTIAHVSSAALLRNPKTGKPLTCYDVAAAASSAEMTAIGVKCSAVGQ